MGKKIVGVISFMNPAGAQEALMRLMTQLRLRGHETEVWFLYAKSSCYRGMPGVRVLLDKSHLSPLDLVRVFLRLLAPLAVQHCERRAFRIGGTGEEQFAELRISGIEPRPRGRREGRHGYLR